MPPFVPAHNAAGPRNRRERHCPKRLGAAVSPARSVEAVSSMTGQDCIIELRHIGKFFEDTRALEGIDLQIANGEFLTLLGPSGCGKTTILRILSGFETPDEGEVLIRGQRMNDVPPERRQVNTVFQNYALFPHMTVRNNVAFGLRMQGCPRQEIETRVMEALRMVHP